MPDARPMPLYRLRDHIDGTNWRPTSFAEAVPILRICSLCHMIPKKTIALPCAHLLCESCQAASAEDGGGGICPLDRQAFAGDECGWYPFPDRIAKSLKAHCWNQRHGCEFVGTMDAVLRHYEAECTFHTVECHQCGVSVLHNELVAHHVAGCRGGAPLATTGRDYTVTMGDIKAAVEELKAAVRDPHHDQLAALQSQVNQLMEQCRQDATRLMEAVCSATQSTDDVMGEVRQFASTVKEIRSRQDSRDEAGAANAGVGSGQGFIPWHTEKVLILRRLEILTTQSLNAIQQSFKPDGTPRILVEMKPLNEIECLSNNTSTTRFDFNLSNINKLFSSYKQKERVSNEWAEYIIWDRRDRFFKVTFGSYRFAMRLLFVMVHWFRVLPSTPLLPRRPVLSVLHKDPQKSLELKDSAFLSMCTVPGSYCFATEIEPLMEEGFLVDGELRLE